MFKKYREGVFHAVRLTLTLDCLELKVDGIGGSFVFSVLMVDGTGGNIETYSFFSIWVLSTE